MTTASFDNPAFDPANMMLGVTPGVSLITEKHLDVLMQLPLPGIVIFVHGVNSDGEWYKQAEEGLCKGLNERLKRCSEHMVHPTPEGGQLRPATYQPELTPEGYINPKIDSDTFVSDEGSFSPVIHFRWGYKAGSKELQEYGDCIYLNEQNYWGGGPFANGCTSLPDLWGSGVDDTLFLWLHVQHINPTPDRLVFSCPPRAYYVLAALRLAKLIESIRKLQADTPITIVCHSQGNMVAMAAAFLGDKMNSAANPSGCVADTYVLCNPPYSLLTKNSMQGWAELGMKDPEGNGGRQTAEARFKTLANFFDIIRKRQGTSQSAQQIDKFIKNELHNFDAQSDKNLYGYGPAKSTTGRVTLYFNPHDQVISSSTIQGMGWRGLSKDEIDTTNGKGVFCQRVFAQGFDVGVCKNYNFWDDRHNASNNRKDFWVPRSPPARYSLSKGLAANRRLLGKVMTVVTAPIAILGLKAFGPPINASPPDTWITPIEAPPLPKSFLPKSVRFGKASSNFDEGYDPPGQSRDKFRQYSADDPYARINHVSKPVPGEAGDDAPQGDSGTEASLRYEHHALLRMQARREGRSSKSDNGTEEDSLSTASADYISWRTEKIKDTLAECIDTHATDHSTIMTNPEHARQALAYDVAVGVCHISREQIRQLRVAADWRYANALNDDSPHIAFATYFDTGLLQDEVLNDWANRTGHEGSMPGTMVNIRKFW
ncbi:T6SS effector phospholipase Tle3 domain-containing protein [Pseudoduganella chitinolytica]|uniref:DUF3274 domain-containing protein n=1 Tax=Pseudoduganella chitinolytica TaxID=34070 RepID=A0ABY8BHZ4_9BURK|nr:DUF3274 domain-containing protein [Pseudoduganella chitinolytica]WEF35291.1 DUF3274 domain-containing protein [Pseudoduganella chitinolytica]